MDENQRLLNKLIGRYTADPFDTAVYPITEYKRVVTQEDERVTIDPDGAIEGTVGATTELEP
jgi:hypothetical protein